MFSATAWLYIIYIVFVCLEVSGKGYVFSCVGEYCTKRTAPVTRHSDQDDDTNRQYIICSDDGKGEIECRYASKEDVDKEPMSKSPYKGPSNEEHINSVLAAGDTSDIVNDDKKASNTVSRNASIGNETVGNITKHAKDNGTARVEKTNNTVLNRNDTSQNVSSRFHRTKLNSTSDAQDSTAFNGVLWMFSKLLDGWLYGYNSVWRLLKAGNCPMPWLTSTRLHCNAVEGDEASWTVVAVSFALFPVLSYICLVRV